MRKLALILITVCVMQPQENYTDPKKNNSVNSSYIQEENSLDSLRKLTLRNVNKVIIGNININFLPAQFGQVKEVILKNVDILDRLSLMIHFH